MGHKLLIALGANLDSATGTPLETLVEAVKMINACGILVHTTSGWKKAPAHPPGSGPDFVNGALAGESDMSAEAALAALKAIEARLGRTATARWSPRVCDLDLLAWDDRIAPSRAELERWIAYGDRAGELPPPDTLILPHPRMQERAFVLVPLAEVAPDWRHPLLGNTVREMLAALDPAEVAAVKPMD